VSTEVDYDGVSYVISSRYRVLVMNTLSRLSAATPSTIAEETGESIAHVSRALQELKEKEYVELLVSEDRKKGLIYALTDDGATIVHSDFDELAGGSFE